MPTYQYTQEDIPSPAEFRELLQTANEQYDPIEELLSERLKTTSHFRSSTSLKKLNFWLELIIRWLLSLERQLMFLEQKHQMTSAEFYGRYQQGKMVDAVEFMAWAGRYRLYLKLKEAVSNSLNMVLTEGVVIPVGQ